MNKSTVTGIIIGVVIASAGAVIANYTVRDDGGAEGDGGSWWPLGEGAAEPAYAEVLSVDPITETQSTPREVCEQVEVVDKAPVKDEHQIAGTAAGAIIGGVLGNQVGGGSGKKVATVAGAVAGGYTGKKVQENMQDKNTVSRLETRCHTEYDTTEVNKGYNVVYRLKGEEGSVRMDYDPGAQIPVEDGQLVITR